MAKQDAKQWDLEVSFNPQNSLSSSDLHVKPNCSPNQCCQGYSEENKFSVYGWRFLAKVILTYHPQLQDLIKVYNDFFVSIYFHKLHLQLSCIICDISARANSKTFRKGEKNSRTNLFIVQNRPQPSHLKCFREVYVAVDNIVYVRANNKIISRDVDSINWNYKYSS